LGPQLRGGNVLVYRAPRPSDLMVGVGAQRTSDLVS
jgi:hypothetical protein